MNDEVSNFILVRTAIPEVVGMRVVNPTYWNYNISKFSVFFVVYLTHLVLITGREKGSVWLVVRLPSVITRLCVTHYILHRQPVKKSHKIFKN